MIKENFEEMLEAQCLTLNTGDVVTGTVTHVSDAELQLDLSAGVTGYIKAEQITDGASVKLTSMFKKGDKIAMSAFGAGFVSGALIMEW